jgi:hypothetical protein
MLVCVQYVMLLAKDYGVQMISSKEMCEYQLLFQKQLQ